MPILTATNLRVCLCGYLILVGFNHSWCKSNVFVTRLFYLRFHQSLIQILRNLFTVGWFQCFRLKNYIDLHYAHFFECDVNFCAVVFALIFRVQLILLFFQSRDLHWDVVSSLLLHSLNSICAEIVIFIK